MSRIRAIVRPHLVPGFDLAGVETHGAEDVETAAALLSAWLDEGEACLVAIDEILAERLQPSIVSRLQASERVLYLAIPGGGTTDYAVTRGARIARMIRRSIGVRITFGSDTEWSDE
jgi:vacuolar-type H+-ATPase subunit F/Vma7